MKVLYIYANTRKKRIEDMLAHRDADTELYGLNHLKDAGIEARHLEFGDVFPPSLGRMLPFNVRHALMYFAARKYDIVFGPMLYTMMIARMLFGRGTQKFILLNINVGRTLGANKENVRGRIFRFLLRKLDGIVCLSSAQKEFLERVHGLPENRAHVVPLGVDLQFFPYVSPELRGETILSVGRDNGRDYKTVVEVARRLPERRFEIACSRRNMEGITDIPENVSIQYDPSLPVLIEKYKTAGVLLLALHDGAHAEGGGSSGQTVLLEAMASGLPIVATEKEGNEDYMTHDKEAYITKNYDVDALVEGLRQLSDVETRQRLARAARTKVEAQFSTARMAENLAKVFKQYA